MLRASCEILESQAQIAVTAFDLAKASQLEGLRSRLVMSRAISAKQKGCGEDKKEVLQDKACADRSVECGGGFDISAPNDRNYGCKSDI